jgi:hypothetical protein
LTRLRLAPLIAAFLAACIPTMAAANFAVAASPPRFELQLKPGEKTRHVLEITNAAATPITLSVRTADWVLSPEGTAVFHEELLPGSCRPWAAIERREVQIGAGQAYRFRFEITVPPDQAAGECRLALMLEGKEAEAVGASPPLSGRMGVIVYGAVAGAAPELRVLGARIDPRDPAAVVLTVTNGGNAHGRLEGFLSATDAGGRVFEAAPGNNPILPGETRAVAVKLTSRGAAAGTRPVLPLVLRGKLEWGRGRSIEVDQRVTE